MKRYSLAAILLPIVLASSAGAGERIGGDDFDWLSGHWCSVSDKQHIEEYWLPARGGMLLGLGRTVQGTRPATFEFMRIAVVDSVPAFIAQPQGGTPVTFKMKGVGLGWVRFENPAHDFPTRVEYRRDGDRLIAHIAGPGKEGKETRIEFEYRRCERSSPHP